MEKNKFENAYFGKRYKTEEGYDAIYLGKAYNKEGDHVLCVRTPDIYNGFGTYVYSSNGEVQGIKRKKDRMYTIHSEWQEPIDEEKLDGLARKYAVEEYQYDLRDEDVDSHCCMEDYKAGYKQGWEDKK